MNIIIDKKLMTLLAVGTFMVTGCVEKKSSIEHIEPIVAETKIETSFNRNRAFQDKISTWKHLEKKKKDECVDCIATTFKDSNSRRVKIDKPIDTMNYATYDYDISPSDTYIQPEQTIKITPRIAHINSSKSSFPSFHRSGDKTIQVGAFRHYSGAEKIARRYDLLSSHYRVKIETGVKDNLPIHRVRIEGFNSKEEAKEFMNRYRISDAFLVRK